MKTVKVFRVTLVLDELWMDALGDFLQHVEDKEVVRWESVSETFDLVVGV